jgi:superfamily II DNA/RNA helicase
VQVEEAVLYCSEGERDALLYYLLATHSGRTLVFVNAISAVRRVAALLKLLGVPAAPLHASMQQRQRLKAIDRFRDNEDAVLVATDVAARGLDIAVRHFCNCSLFFFVNFGGWTGPWTGLYIERICRAWRSVFPS